MTLFEINAVVNRIRYKNWGFKVATERNAMFLQVRFLAPDNETGEPELQHGRKWSLSRHMTPSEIVTTALKAVLTAEEHEAREQFKYRDVAIFGPHIDVEALVSQARSLDKRPPIPSLV